MFENSHRRQHGNIRLLEKQLRPEVIERTLEFLDVIINQIIYQENIYHSVLFDKHQMYHSIVYLCNDKDLSGYISLCVASLRELLIHQLVDMISINIHSNTNERFTPILRRYLIEFHSIDDPCLRAIYDNTKDLIQHLDQIFAQTIRSIQQMKCLPNSSRKFSKKWTFQMRLSSESKTRKLGEILKEKPIYKEFLLINEQAQLLSSGKDSIVSQIKSFHCERLHLQIMCEDDQYEQKMFEQSNKSSQDEDDETDYESDSDLFEEKVRLKHVSSNQSKRKKNLLLIDDENSLDRYHLTEINRDQIDLLQYLSDDDDQEENDNQRPDSSINPLRPNRTHDDDSDDENADEEDF